MNQEEKKQLALLEHTVSLLQKEVDAKDALIREQKLILDEQEKHIQKLTGLLNQILNM